LSFFDVVTCQKIKVQDSLTGRFHWPFPRAASILQRLTAARTRLAALDCNGNRSRWCMDATKPQLPSPTSTAIADFQDLRNTQGRPEGDLQKNYRNSDRN
jgi:hypothetical protein